MDKSVKKPIRIAFIEVLVSITNIFTPEGKYETFSFKVINFDFCMSVCVSGENDDGDTVCIRARPHSK